MVCLSQSLYGIPGLAPLINVLFWERCDFRVSFSGRDMSGNIWNRPSGSSMVDMGISSNIMKSPSPKYNMTFWDMIIYSDTIHWSDISPNRNLVYELDPMTIFDVITVFREVSIGHLQRVRLSNRGRLLLRTPGPFPFETCICSNIETILSWTCHVYGPFEFRASLGTSIWLLGRGLNKNRSGPRERKKMTYLVPSKYHPVWLFHLRHNQKAGASAMPSTLKLTWTDVHVYDTRRPPYFTALILNRVVASCISIVSRKTMNAIVRKMMDIFQNIFYYLTTIWNI